MGNKLTINEKLDAVLNILNHDNRPSLIHEDFMEKLKNKISINELDLILEKLERDLFLIEKPTFYDGNPKDITPRKVYHITWEGRLFIENGGYVQKNINESISLEIQNNEIQRRIRNDRFLVRGTIWVAIGTIGLLIVEILNHHSELYWMIMSWFGVYPGP